MGKHHSTRQAARTPAEWLNTLAQAAKAFRYLHEDLGLSDETYNRLKKRLLELAAEHEKACVEGRVDADVPMGSRRAPQQR